MDVKFNTSKNRILLSRVEVHQLVKWSWWWWQTSMGWCSIQEHHASISPFLPPNLNDEQYLAQLRYCSSTSSFLSFLYSKANFSLSCIGLAIELVFPSIRNHNTIWTDHQHVQPPQITLRPKSFTQNPIFF